MPSDTLKQAFHRSWWALVIQGVLAIAIGVLILVKPLGSVAAFALVIALWALVSGITQIVHSIDVKPFLDSWWMLLLGGLVGAGFGVAALYYYPALSLAFAVTWVSLWLLFSGVLGITVAVQQKRAGLPWGWVFVWGLVSVVAGIAALAHPSGTLAAIMGLMASFGIVGGLALLIAAFRLKSFANDVKEAVSHSSVA